MSVDFGKSVSTLNKLYKYPQVILLTSDYPNIDHTIMRDKPVLATEKRGCCSRRHDGIIRQKIQVLLHFMLLRRFFTPVIDPKEKSQR